METPQKYELRREISRKILLLCFLWRVSCTVSVGLFVEKVPSTQRQTTPHARQNPWGSWVRWSKTPHPRGNLY